MRRWQEPGRELKLPWGMLTPRLSLGLLHPPLVLLAL